MASEPFERSAAAVEEPRGEDAPGAEWFRTVWRRRWWMASFIATSLAIAAFYLAFATRIYHVAALLSVDGTPLRPTTSPTDNKTTADFLYAQIESIKSSDVLKESLKRVDTKQMRIFADVSDPFEHLHHILEVDLLPETDLIEIALNSPYPQEAAEVVNAVADTYVKRQSQQNSAMTSGLKDLTTRRDQLESDRAAQEKALGAFALANPDFAASEPTKGVAERITQLNQALAGAKTEADLAKASVDAALAAQANPFKMQALVDAARAKNAFTTLDQQKAQVKEALVQAEALQAAQRKTLLPEHPLVIATQRKIEQLNLTLASLETKYVEAYGVYLQQQRDTAAKKQQDIQSLLDEQSKLATGLTAKAQEHARLKADLAKATQAVAEVDQKMHDSGILGESAGHTVKVVETARPPALPFRPHKTRVLLMAAIVGLIAGLGFASLRSR